MNIIYDLVESVNSFLWGENILVIMLIFSAIYLSFKMKFLQFRNFKKFKYIFSNSNKDKGVSSIEAFLLGIACRVGAGNIAGVVAAISIGGPGSIFWMWLVALFGSATAFVESTLAVVYKEKNQNGIFVGGTPYILKNRLNKKFLGTIYAIASLICYFGVTQVMSNSITESVTSVYNLNILNFDLKYLVTIFTLLIVVYVLFFSRSNKDSIINSLNMIVPFMSIIYILCVLYVLIMNFNNIPLMFGNIFYQAFGGKEFLGGTFGVIVMNGVRRGLFSNEAGSGNSSYAAGAVNIDYPAKQGIVQLLGVFVDTLIMCSSTAFMVLLAPDYLLSKYQGMQLFQNVMIYHIGIIAKPFVIILMFFFCISTILAVAYYGKSAINYISNKKIYITLYQIFLIVMIYLGGVTVNNFVWSLADFGLGIVTVINIICILPISNETYIELKKFENEIENR
jgi:amino acid carrier protein